MAGFAAAIGGAGQAATRHGEQIRQLLEERRHNFGMAFLQLSQQTSDPELRDKYREHGLSILGGSDWGKIVPRALKDLQTHVQSAQAISKAVGGPPDTPQQVPTAAGPGQVAGTAFKPGAPTSAALPSTNIAQPSSPEQNFSPIGGLSPLHAPTPSVPPVEQATAQAAPQATPQAAAQATLPPPPISGDLPQGYPKPRGAINITNEFRRNFPEMGTELGFNMYKPMVDAEIAKDAALAEKIQEQQATLAFKREGIRQIQQQPYYQGLPGLARANFEAQAYGLAPINFPGGMMTPDRVRVDATGLSPQEKAVYGIPSDASGLFTVEFDKLSRAPIRATPGWAGAVSTTNDQGVQGVQSRNDALAHGIKAVGGGPSLSPGVAGQENRQMQFTSPTGQPEIGTPREIRNGSALTPVPGAKNPSFVPTTRVGQASVNTVDAQGNPVTLRIPSVSQSSKGGAGIPPVGPAQMGSAPSGGAPSGGNNRSFLKPLTSTTQSMRESAPKVLSLVDKVANLVDKQESQLGPALSRWNEFYAGTVGAPNPDFTKLRTDTMLLQTLLIRMHVGARGGTAMMDHFKSLLDSGRQSPENMRAALDEIKSYAKEVQGETPGSVNPAPATGQPTLRYNPATGKIEAK